MFCEWHCGKMSAPSKSTQTADKLYSWGANSYGQLGHGHKIDLVIPTMTKSVDFVPRSLSGGGGHTLFITSEGKCYSCGWNTKGQLGLGPEAGQQDVEIPRLMSGPLKDTVILKAVGGWDFTMIISADKVLYGCGSNMFGQLGKPDINNSTTVPDVIPLPVTNTVDDVVCGMRHTVILSGDTVLTSGVGKKGQLGCLSPGGDIIKKTSQFLKVGLPPGCGRPLSVIAGAYHSGVLTDTGQVVLWGENKHGQLACDPSSVPCQLSPTAVPQQLFNHEKVKELHSGWTHLVAILGDGELYSWGWNEHGICGTGDEKDVLEPVKVKVFENHKVKVIGCGAGHSFAIVESSNS